MSVLAAVDIGSNSVRLKVARIVHHRLRTVHEDRVVTRLGESVFRFGMLSPEAMDATIEVLRRFLRTVQRFGADRVRVVATSALRDARNAAAFTTWTHSATGWKVEIISGLEEGRLIHLGVLTNFRAIPSKLLLLDLGGGSCELTLSVHRHIRLMVSLPLGAVRLTQEFLPHDPPGPIEIQRLRKHIAEEIVQVGKRIEAAKISSMMATSGTAAAIAGATGAIEPLARGLKSAPVSRKAVFQLAEELSKLDAKSRAKLPGIGPRRAEIVIAGVYVFAELMGHCNLSSFRYSSLGLRDGLLAQMHAEHDQATRSRRQIEADRRDAVVAMGRHYQVDMKGAENLRGLVMQLFWELRRVHGLPAEYESWLSAAAMLNDVGSFVNRTGRHRHTYHLISNSEIFGFTPEQRKIIAAIARYLGRMRPDPSDEPIRSLSDPDEDLVPKAIVLLRLAKALNHGQGRSVRRVTAKTNREQVALKLVAKGNTELERWMVLKERSLFHEVFGRDLVVDLA